MMNTINPLASVTHHFLTFVYFRDEQGDEGVDESNLSVEVSENEEEVSPIRKVCIRQIRSQCLTCNYCLIAAKQEKESQEGAERFIQLLVRW